MDRGDTAAILGVFIGVVAAFSVHGPYPDDLDPGPYVLSVPRSTWRASPSLDSSWGYSYCYRLVS